MNTVLKILLNLKNLLIVVLTPILLSPILAALGGQEASCAYVVMIMAVFWVTEALPISVTALLPVFMFPLVGVLSASDVGKVFFNDTTLMFIGGMIVAIAIEQWNIHKRIALVLLLVLGTKPVWLMLGIMVPTWFLSMWISNTATTSMMLPIANAILLQLKRTEDTKTNEEDEVLSIEMEDFKVVDVTPHGHVNEHVKHHVNNNMARVVDEISDTEEDKMISKEKEKSEDSEDAEWSRLAKALSLCIAYAANIGGTGSMIGSTPNLVLKGQIEKVYENLGKESSLTFTSWLAFGIPTSFVIMLLAWLWLQTFYLRCSIWTSVCRKGTESATSRIKQVIKEQYKKLGPVSFGQVAVSIHFLALAILWITRDFGGNYGWAHTFKDKFIRDSVPGLLVGCSLFIFPSSVLKIFSSDDSERKAGAKPLLSWKIFSTKMPWGIVFLLGGGYSMAKASQESGLSAWISSQLNALHHLESVSLVLAICFIMAAVTEVTSNAATCALFLPILGDLALTINADPLYIMLPAAIASSFAFMLPVATPPNAVIFSYGYIRVIDMAKCGFVLNIIAVLVLIASTETLGRAIFGFEPLSAELMQNTTLQTIT